MSLFIPHFSIAPLIAAAPNLVAYTFEKTPPKLPIAVLTAETITTSLIFYFLNFYIQIYVKLLISFKKTFNLLYQEKQEYFLKRF